LIATRVDELLRDHPVIVERFVDLGEIPRHAFVADVGRGQVRNLARAAPFDLGIEELIVGRPKLLPPLVTATHDLHVLLRHRLRSASL
jgi:hypothetical protein